MLNIIRYNNPSKAKMFCYWITFSLTACGGADDPFVPGLDERPVSQTCLAGDAPNSGEFQLVPLWPEVHFEQPIGLVQMPGDADSDYYVMEKTGRIRHLSSDFTSNDVGTFLDLRNVVETGGEGGVFSMAFHPEYPTQPYVFVAYMVDEGGFITRLSRFTSKDGLTASNELQLLDLPQSLSPYGRGSIHNAGNLAFGPDGYLYMSLGDDKRTFEVGTPDQLYGSIIRIDVNTETEAGYSIPEDNPFNNEIYAYGFRNPWRFSFDKFTGDLWVGDVGEECFEEINKVEMGQNYGWPNWEAHVCGPGECAGDNTLPIYQYHTADACGPGNSITGGYVYRGALNPALVGKYVYGDYQTGLVWAYDSENQFNESVFAEGVSEGIAAFGEDNSGEIYHIDIRKGAISRIEGNQGTAVPGPPEKLSETGCFDQVGDPLIPSKGVQPYSIAQQFWSDGAEKQRFFSLPDGSRFTIDQDGDWALPNGGVLIKHFTLDGENFETRFLVRYSNGSYGFYTYEWISPTEATLVDAKGKDTQLSNEQDWRYPTRNECSRCHTRRAGGILGPETRQMNIDHTYAQTGRTANQFGTLKALGMLAGNTTALPPFPKVDDNDASLQDRAQAYIHINCASCHRGVGGSQSVWDARSTTPWAQKGLCNVTPITTVTGYPDERYITPGNHQSSTLWWRMHARGMGQMPPIGSNVVDQEGADLLAEWIDAMTPNTCLR